MKQSFDMTEGPYKPPQVVYILLGVAAFIIIIAGIKAAEEIIVPFLLALFFTFIIFPVIFWSRRHNIPLWIAIIFSLALIFVLFFFFFFVLGTNIQSLSEKTHEYHVLLEQRWVSVQQFWQQRGIDMAVMRISDIINSQIIKDLALTSLGSMSVFFEDSIMILILMIFMLIASANFPAKVAKMTHKKKEALQILDQIVHMISHYMLIKTIISFFTGLAVTILLLLINIEHAIFWGFLAFLLNYIPNIGSFLAAIPVVLLTILEFGFETALYIVIGYAVINTLLGNVIEPRIMGKSTEISEVAIFISLIFWGWVLGPVGMFLSVPLTIVFKIICSHFESTRWISILIGPDEPVPDHLHPTHSS